MSDCIVIVPHSFCMLKRGHRPHMEVSRGIFNATKFGRNLTTVPADTPSMHCSGSPPALELHYTISGLRGLGAIVIDEPFAITLFHTRWKANGYRDEETINEITGGDL